MKRLLEVRGRIVVRGYTGLAAKPLRVGVNFIKSGKGKRRERVVRPRREMNEFIVFNICPLYCLNENENYVDSRKALGRKV